MARKKKKATNPTATEGNTVRVHYRGTLDDGSEFDSSHKREEPLAFTVGSGEMIEGFDQAVTGMEVGETKSIRLTPEQAYGDINPAAYTELSRESFPEDFPVNEGSLVPLTGPANEQLVGTITEVTDNSVTVDLNHPMAGKDLNFEIELVGIDEKDK
jgi:peptidylprolyl isomerase